MKQLKNLKYATLTLPPMFNNLTYFAPVYRHSIKEIKGYCELGWHELRYLTANEPNAELNQVMWMPAKTTYFKLQLKPDYDTQVINTSIVGFGQHKVNTTKTLNMPYIRHVVYLDVANVCLQLQLIVLNVALGLTEATALRKKLQNIVTETTYETLQSFFEAYLKGLERTLTTRLKEQYKTLRHVQITKCKLVEKN